MSTCLPQDEGLVVVRRFTDELRGDTALERAAISAQQYQDETEKEVRRRRMEALYQGSDHQSNDDGVHEMETARLALEKACKEIGQIEEKSSRSRLGLIRKSARTTANKAMLGSFVHDFAGLQAVVGNFESEWKGGQTTVGQRFRKVCQKLDDHKGAFAIFPSQDMYTSTLCGSLSLIVNAAVNHNDIAEKLSEMVADIADKATRAASMVMIYRTKSFRELFSDLYAQVFLFYRDAIEWYAKSKVAKVFDSFNANLVKPYEKAAARIENLVTEMYREAEVARSAQMAVLAESFEDELQRQRSRVTDRDDLVFAGRQGRRLLMLMHDSAHLEETSPQSKANRLIEAVVEEESADDADDLLSRAGTKAISNQLEPHVVGTEGPSLFKDGKFWLPDIDVSIKLGDWMSPDTTLSTLWITSPAAARGFPGSRAAALIALVAAWESSLPIISHFCARPYHGDISQGRSVEKTGLIGLVYSLIIQLLQFNVKDDAFRISKDAFDRLDGSDGSWPSALALLRDLLQSTPQLQRCIIDGLNDLCFSSGAEWCGAFLHMLLEHQRTTTSGFRILLTTTGQSRVLPQYVQVRNRILVQTGAKEVIREGRWVKAEER
ncbi:hypothetical protein B5807_02486 [Epicoccum nigrum]|uniref:DUF7708 domain-containing protein n=1 Tax=Epicoccum nigrum TaxID=105696 RepID=A0A1Y2M9B7_EPING|nr:hypothetical protein B5807_02486 [Epicoccum nigrum]